MNRYEWICIYCGGKFYFAAKSLFDWKYCEEICPNCGKSQDPSDLPLDFTKVPSFEDVKKIFSQPFEKAKEYKR